MNLTEGINAVIQLLSMNITIEGYTFSLFSLVIYFFLLGVFCLLIGGMLK